MILDKKKAIFDATLDLISKNGFHAAPMSLVAKNANVAAGTIYHYFDSKEELISELFQSQKYVIEKIIADADENGMQKVFKDRFFQVYTCMYNYFVKNPKVFLFIEQYMCSPFMHKNSKEEFEAFFLPVSDFLKKGLFGSSLREMNSRLAVSMFYGNISALVKLTLSGSIIIGYDTTHNAVNVCWDGMRNPRNSQQ
jgi:AcrR family transcriptional regulator